MKKKIISGALAVITSIMLIGCGTNSDTKTTNDEGNKKVNIMVSVYPLKEFADKIAGDKAEVSCMVPDNMEPHDYEPKTKDFEALIKSDAFIYNGLGLETWVDQVKSVIGDKELRIVDSSEGVEVRKEGEVIDPHSWLSLKEAEKQAENIKDTLVEIDEDNKAYYEENYDAFVGELESLYNEYKEKFDNLSTKDFVTGHAAFGYLCRDFGLQQKSIENLFAEGEPTPKQLEQLVTFCKENNIKTVFSESLASPKVSETLAKEVGAEVVPILTLESNEDDKSYVEAMRYNLEEIYKCLSQE
ncbi:metal ABC transporter solute-binding protein, Zn/Mn family [Clostridium butyricum]|uniref:metal ABC transporter solute-binding protein, Zn/Mn family n=1 Tax=Clostridium butyricum TaxID=1492 RepID=UPI00071B3B52|nr:zinc ABC transporter substrate-binding protein [Clostridium butyricum]ALP89329.1 ABC transporter substrate-binding protein [Clostridium butyricum]ALS15794.1 ABC transporter substrate-binding protein [Clostridium butyricum]ANF12942.1 ABC transporter substrate-binding protein [Clostridium butyricum]AOR93012.1 ABC transporter substrate-binding protein [Clostridium butyricum]MCI3007125.1 zinc ABC transporter substrate-binding protein [Clostridium butyricum]